MSIKLINRYYSKITVRKVIYVLLVSLPVILYLYKFSIANHGGIFRGEDWDYFAQSYEAARQSILHYHQFPWWNPWMNGGQPLFANPQFGLFSIQMPLVLLFGTVAGLHYSIMLYFILGFWGMYRLLQRVGSTSKLISVLLSYIWTFSGFSAWHLAGGHFTFAVYLLSPWVLLTILNIHKKWGWLWFGLWASLIIHSAAHYLTIEALAICGVIATVQVVRQVYSKHLRTFKSIVPLLLPYVYALGLIILLCSIRLFYTFQFTHQYPRPEPLDPPVSFILFIASLTFRRAVDPGSLTIVRDTHYGWTEYANYFGIITLGLFFYLFVRRFEKIRSISIKEWFILAAIGLAALLSLGAFSQFSPFSILHHLPIFNQMRVPSRFICWFGLGVILFLSKLPKKPIVYFLLVISTLDVFLVSYPIINYSQKPYKQNLANTKQFEQYEYFETDPNLGVTKILDIQNLRLLRATQNNYGEVYGYEPILNAAEFYFLPGTSRCGINKGCRFVLTNNAIVTHWSPSKIDLRRVGDGPIRLNMNPGKVWEVNGKSPFSEYRVLELQKSFTIDDPAENISISYHPSI